MLKDKYPLSTVHDLWVVWVILVNNVLDGIIRICLLPDNRLPVWVLLVFRGCIIILIIRTIKVLINIKILLEVSVLVKYDDVFFLYSPRKDRWAAPRRGCPPPGPGKATFCRREPLPLSPLSECCVAWRSPHWRLSTGRCTLATVQLYTALCTILSMEGWELGIEAP